MDAIRISELWTIGNHEITIEYLDGQMRVLFSNDPGSWTCDEVRALSECVIGRQLRWENELEECNRVAKITGGVK